MNRQQYIIGLGLAALVVIVIIAVYSVGKKTPSKPAPSQISLTDYTTDGSTVQLTIEGPVNADELHRSSSISVSRDGRAVEFDKTYGDIPITSANYVNNQDAFDDFMAALQNAGFTKQAKGSKTQQDDTGQCPLGQRYTYELITNDTVVLQTWSSSCLSKAQTFGGNAQLVRTLFQAQIPNYSTLQSASQKATQPTQ